MATLTPQTVRLDGTAPTYSPADSAGDNAPCGSRVVLVVRNASASDVTLTVATPGTLPTGDDYPDKAITVPATGEAWVPMLNEYRDTTDRLAHMSYSDATDVTVAVVEI